MTMLSLLLALFLFPRVPASDAPVVLLAGQSNMTWVLPEIQIRPHLGGTPCVLAKYTMPSTSIVQWRAGLMANALAELDRNVQAETSQLVLVWHQGENDGLNGGIDYEAELTALLEETRAHCLTTHGIELDIVIGRINQHRMDLPSWVAVRSAQESVAAVQGLMLISTDDFGNDLHYFGHYDDWGERIAEAILTTIQSTAMASNG